MRSRSLPLLFSLAACAANDAQMPARAAQENAWARKEAERVFFTRGNRPLTPQPTIQSLTLRGIAGSCRAPNGQAPTDPVEARLGQAEGATTFEAACALVTGRSHAVRIRLAGSAEDTLLTAIPEGSGFAVTPSGTVTRYLLTPQVKETRHGFAKGVSCCCDAPPQPELDARFTVVVGPYPATEEEVIPYDVVTVSLCDPAAPQ